MLTVCGIRAMGNPRDFHRNVKTKKQKNKIKQKQCPSPCKGFSTCVRNTICRWLRASCQNTPARLGQQNPILPKTEHANLIPAQASSQMLMEARRGGGAEGMESADRLVTCWSHDQQVVALWLPWCVHESAPSHPWSGSHACNQRQWRPEESRQIVGPWQETGKSTQNHHKLRDFLSC